MKKTLMIICSIILFTSLNFGASALENGGTGITTGKADWKPVKGSLLIGHPWKLQADAKIFKSENGTVIKFVNGKETFKFDFKNHKVYKLTNGQWIQKDVKSMIQRNQGKMIIVSCCGTRYRINFDVPLKSAAKYLSGPKKK